MDRLFFYGTLRHVPLLARVLGVSQTALSPRPARLHGHAAHWAEGDNFPMLREAAEAVADGIVLDGVTPAAQARLDYYEGCYGFTLGRVTVETTDGPYEAHAYLHGRDAGLRPGAPWDLGEWAARWGDIATLAADEVMLGFPDREPEVNRRRYRMILARAGARVRARAPSPTTLRRPTRPNDVEEFRRTQPYANFFAVEEYGFRHRRFDGSWSPTLNRAAFFTADAATVLPYDSPRDRVLLIEQFRAGPYGRGDSECWSVEAIAGLVDPGETPESTVRREAVEEAGIEVGRLHPVYGYYPSPGAKTEFIYSFVGEANLPDDAGGLGGLAAEGEDIRAHVVPFDRAMDLVETGEIGNAPLILTLLWLARNRERLRTSG
ncbi:nudix-type nucleoside diphosphatase, YffH/AdpP family [Rhodovulum sp. ES.010]|uniref:NUDIX domain-containing protein n=1 Tax=Rhodovulum sp. ES.010 TaxID=1882821 RepID=UPI0009280730|nr:NUDIX domain-containing protein [Rhodovulum sp. ES.010]SIO26111.1 nudix-type nucleoside diphosphatase, YffH/AdpP family [Rhodovulum sp. ES.010]